MKEEDRARIGRVIDWYCRETDKCVQCKARLSGGEGYHFVALRTAGEQAFMQFCTAVCHITFLIEKFGEGMKDVPPDWLEQIELLAAIMKQGRIGGDAS